MLMIFDCDGVLRSISWEGMYVAYLHIARYANKNPYDFWLNIEEFKRWCGNDWQFNLKRMGIVNKSEYPIIAKMFHEIYDPCIYTFPWVKDVLMHLSEKHTLTILSSSDSLSVRKSLEESARYVSFIKGFDDVKSIKPNPEGIHSIMNDTGFDASSSSIIGDSNADILAGKNAGIKTIGVTWGVTGAKEMKGLNPDFVINNPQHLKELY
ncbi:HAD family hydrolase [Patescibacteria group bacterium]